jgi:hypothetical protein
VPEIKDGLDKIDVLALDDNVVVLSGASTCGESVIKKVGGLSANYATKRFPPAEP